MDANGLALFVVDEVGRRQAHQHGLAVAHLEPRLNATADHLLLWNAVDLLRP